MMRRFVDLGAVVHRHLNEILRSGELYVDGVRVKVIKRDGGEAVIVAEGFVKIGDEIVKTQTYMLRVW
jgi:hypothetical protein